MFKAIVAMCLCVITLVVNAAEFSLGPMGYGVAISGEIKKGDSLKLIETNGANYENPKYTDEYVFLDSPGGDVDEALRIAEWLMRNLTSVTVMEGKHCMSACTILFAAGSDRTLRGDAILGFHRLSTSRKEIDVRKVQSQIDPANQKVNAFFKKTGFPTELVERMNQTPPTEIFTVNLNWLIDHDIDDAISYQPTFLDVVERHCGVNPMRANLKRGVLLSTSDTNSMKKWLICMDEVKVANRKIQRGETIADLKRKKVIK